MDMKRMRFSAIVGGQTNKTAATVIGCGAIGRNVALALAQLGIKNIKLIDFDTVSAVNVGPQGFKDDEIGKNKVDALKDEIFRIDKNIKVTTVLKKFSPSLVKSDVVFCCVDSISTREEIFKSINPKLFIDGRMAAETMEIYTVHDRSSKKHYKSSIFPQSQAVALPCTAKATNYCANIASGIMIAQFTKWLRGMKPEHKFDFNLLTLESTAHM